jgi:hypothetical protein
VGLFTQWLPALPRNLNSGAPEELAETEDLSEVTSIGKRAAILPQSLGKLMIAATISQVPLCSH